MRKKCSHFAVRRVGIMRARCIRIARRATATVLFYPRFCLPGQLFNASGAASRDGLIGCSENPMDAENLMQRIECHEHHGGCAIRIRDDSTMELHVVWVDLGND